jgi:hypothetical protein
VALSIKPVSGGPRDVVAVVKDVTFSSSYPSGGEPVNASDFELTKILFVEAEVAHAGKFQPMYDPSAGTLRLLASGASGAAFSEVTTGSNNSSVTARILVMGTR